MAHYYRIASNVADDLRRIAQEPLPRPDGLFGWMIRHLADDNCIVIPDGEEPHPNLDLTSRAEEEFRRFDQFFMKELAHVADPDD